MADVSPALEQQFHAAMLDIYEAALRLKPPYHATRFRTLFTVEQLAIARDRLEKHEFEPPSNGVS